MPLLSAPNITISNESFASPCGTLVHIFVGGEGAPVVALHCSGPQGQAWRGLLAELGHRFQMHCTDLYGYERSAAWCGPHDLTLSDEADLIGALIRRCNRPVHLIGHLIGHSHRGALALRIAIDHPDRHRPSGSPSTIRIACAAFRCMSLPPSICLSRNLAAGIRLHCARSSSLPIMSATPIAAAISPKQPGASSITGTGRALSPPCSRISRMGYVA